MQKELFKDYVVLDAKIKTLENEKQLLRDAIVSAMKAEKTEKMETAFGTFTVAARAVWKYSKKIIAMQEKVKIAMTTEQEKGTAKKSMIEYLVYSAPKSE